MTQNNKTQLGDRSGNQKEEKTEEQKEMEFYFKMMLKNLSIKSLFKWFDNNIRLMESGESKIDEMQSAEIERKIKDSCGLQKFQPMNYQGSLRQF